MTVAFEEVSLVALPYGGPLGMAPEVAGVFLAHIECCCAKDEKTALDAAQRRDDMWSALNALQRGYVLLVCSAVGRLGK